MAEMTPAEMIEEMRRKPDEHLLLEWVEQRDGIDDGTRAAISGYFLSLEEDN
jgi:hypothetical protein